MNLATRRPPAKSVGKDAEREALEEAYEKSLVDDRRASRVLRIWVLWILVALGILGIVAQLRQKDINHDDATIEEH